MPANDLTRADVRGATSTNSDVPLAQPDSQREVSPLEVLDALPTPILVCDAAHVITYANLRIAQLLGLKPADLIGRHWGDLSGRPPSGIRRFEQSLADVFSTGRRVSRVSSVPFPGGIRDFYLTFSPLFAPDAVSVRAVVVSTVELPTMPARQGAKQPASPLPTNLSRREIDVLRLLALGHMNREIAAQLAISVRTVEAHRLRLERKLGTKNRSEIVRHARAAGLLDFDTDTISAADT